MRRCLVSLLICTVGLIYGQKISFSPPISYETRLSGSFGEPRSAHFHAGIDYKQFRGIPYDTIYASADGWISRISVQPDGYGNVLYIDHHDSLRTVYAHLHEFRSDLAELIEAKLYERKVHKINYKALADSIWVNSGDYIGIMGNTGRSSATHLHFEIRDIATDEAINPFLFNLMPEDNQAPVINGIVIFQLGAGGEILDKEYVAVSFRDGNHFILNKQHIRTDAAAIGIGIHCYDTMNGASNHNGIYSLNMFVNGAKHYAFSLDSISFGQSQYIHSHMDYAAKNANQYITKCFRQSTNPLKIYDKRYNNGMIIPSEVISQKIRIEVSDYRGNISAVQLSISGNGRYQFPKSVISDRYKKLRVLDSLVYQDSINMIKIEPYSVDAPQYVALSADRASCTIETAEEVPFFKYILIQKNLNKGECDQCTFVSKNKKGQTVNYGAKRSGNKIFTYVNKTGEYRLLKDTIAPTITVISLPNGGKNNGLISFVIKDNLEPVYKKDFLRFELFIDGAWKLCQYDIKTGKIWHRLNFSPGALAHELILRVTDSAGNVSEVVKMFKY